MNIMTIMSIFLLSACAYSSAEEMKHPMDCNSYPCTCEIDCQCSDKCPCKCEDPIQPEA